MKTLLSAATLLLLGAHLGAVPQPLQAQVSFEGRIGSSMPTGDLTADPGLNQTAGLGFAVEGMYTFNPQTSAYLGFSRQAFNCDGCSADVVSRGLQGGVKYILGNGPAMPWVRGGLMLHKVSVDGVDGDWGFGIDSGVGIDWALNPMVAIVPAVRLNSYSSGNVRLTYIGLDLGLHIHPGG